MSHYTGVGSRETPHKIMSMISDLAYILSERGWALRSGCANGADSAFETGSLRKGGTGQEELYLPYNGFQGAFRGGVYYIPKEDFPDKWEEARKIVSEIHPAWGQIKQDGTPVLSQFAEDAHTRNVFQVLGQDLETPSKMLVCWARTDHKGEPKGGTRTAWVLAMARGIPCVNLYRQADKERIEKYLSENADLL